MHNFTLVNTRPCQQSQESVAVFKRYDFDVIDFPAIEIAGFDHRQQKRIKSDLDEIVPKDIVIFTSQFAVSYAFKISPNWAISDSVVVIAVGTKTAHVLEQNCQAQIWLPQKHNSHGVVELLKGLKKCSSIKLISAENGRQVIKNFASDNAIAFKQINVYQRQIPQTNPVTLQKLLSNNNLAVLATSTSTLNHLNKMLTSIELLKFKRAKLICASNRIAQTATKMGYFNVYNAKSANPEKMAQFIATLKNR